MHISKVPRQGFTTPGLACENVGSDIRKKVKEEQGPSEDSVNRKRVLNAIKHALANGKSLEEITDELSKDENNIRYFDYLLKNGIDLQKTFSEWYKAYERNKERNKNINITR